MVAQEFLGLANLGLFVVLVTGFGAFVALSLSKGRIENEMALTALGFQAAPGFDVALFSTQGGWGLAIIGAFVSFLQEFLQAAEQTAQAQRSGNTNVTFTLGWLAWGCLLFYLPKPIAIIALVILIWGLVARLYEVLVGTGT